MIEVLFVLIFAALATGTLGVFLLLKKEVMTTDALSHTIILGIVLAFFLTEDTRSPLLILGASLVGVFTVVLIQWLQKIKLIKGDAAIGLVFSALFALAIILISRYLDHIHLDIDIVLVGEVLFAPFNRMTFFGLDLPVAIVQLGILTIVNLIFVFVLYRPLKMTTFDETFSMTVGIYTTLLYYALMVLVSVTAVTAFDAVGAILVISFFVAPAASAYLLVNRLSHVIGLTLLFAVFNSVIGFFIGYYMDLTISGTTATVAFITFMIVFLLNRNGYLRRRIQIKQARVNLLQLLILIYIRSEESVGLSDVYAHFNYGEKTIDRALKYLQETRLVMFQEDKYHVTNEGESYINRQHAQYGLSLQEDI